MLTFSHSITAADISSMSRDPRSLNLRALAAISLLVLVFVLAGCASREKVRRPAPETTVAEEPGVTYDESFDPLSVGDYHFSIPRKNDISMVQSQELAAAPDSAARDTSWVTVSGYQVQLIQTEDAQLARDVLRNAIIALDTDVEIVYHAPYYKVRAGRFISRYDAERLQALADTKNFVNSWVVRTPIQVRAYELMNHR